MKLFIFKSILAQIIYFLVSLPFLLLLNLHFTGVAEDIRYSLVSYSPSLLALLVAWAITVPILGFPKNLETNTLGQSISIIIYFIIHQFISFIIVNAITLLFTRKTLKKLLGN
jgi:hypothetical protein